MNVKITMIFVGVLLAVTALASANFLTWSYPQTSAAIVVPPSMVEIKPAVETIPTALAAETVIETELPAIFADPISRARERVTKKPFGLEIIPGHSPVENDHFAGFHVGVDFETFDDEQDSDIVISAVCDGRLILKGRAKGYGGVAVQECDLLGETVSVIYGHLKETSIVPRFNAMVKAGETIGVLGKGESEETDGVRKHLHLGIRVHADEVEPVEIASAEGESAQVDKPEDIRGYVKNPVEMEQWLDILNYISP